jgi:peroxiredoxin Q/BCP
MLNVGTKAPDFKTLNQDNSEVSLENLRGKWVVLYFYPKDDTPGCTVEAEEFEKLRKEFEKENVVILGVSKDNVNSHKKFCSKYSLNFQLLADTKGEIVKAYKAFAGPFVRRITYLISPEGIIEYSWPKVNPSLHAKEVLEKIKELKSQKV